MPQIDPAWAVATLLLWARLGVLVGLSPLAQAVKTPVAFWVLFTLALAGTLCAALGVRAPVPGGVAHLSLLLCGEVALGALLGFSLHAAFATLAMAGRLLDLQMGFGMATVLDPVTRANAPVIGVALTMLVVAVFFGLDGHHALLRGIAWSVREVPPGAAWHLPTPVQLLRVVGGMFSLAVVVVAPALFMLLMIEVVLAVAARVLPQMNVLFIGMPVKALAGMALLAPAAPGLASILRRVISAVFDFWQEVLP